MINKIFRMLASDRKARTEIDLWVFQEKVKMLYRNQTQSWVMSILAASLIAYLAIDTGHVVVGMGWWVAFVAITIVRTWNTVKFCRLNSQRQISEFRPWFKWFYFYTFIAGLAWCTGGILIGSGVDQLNQVYILIVLIGVGAAAIPLLGVVHRVMLAFQVPTTIPYLIYIAILFEDRGVFLVFMFGLYLIGVTYAIRSMDKNLSQSLVTQYENEQLANTLSESNQELQNANEKLETLSLEDALTGLHNRRYFEARLETEWQRQARECKPLALMVIDIDHFKLYNDTYGHAEGDECLRRVAHTLKTSLHRTADVISRIGGEEFVLLLPAVDESGALKVADEINKQLRRAALTHATSPLSENVTISIGIACVVPSQGETTLSLFKTADKALYRAKAKGRNQVVIGEMEKLEG